MVKKPHRRGRSRGWKGYLLSFFLGSLLVIVGYVYLTREKPLGPEAFSQKVFLVHQIIENQIHEMGIPKRNILIQTSFKKENGVVWKQFSMKIRVLPSLPFSLIERNFRRGLSAIGKSTSIQTSQISNGLQLEVKVLNRVTHRLTFVLATPSTLKVGHRPKIALVIDDLGGENKISQELLHLDLPLTLSILPFTPYSKTLAEEAHRRGKEIILHLPMEPRGYPSIKPGEGVLLCEMDEPKLLRQLSKDIEAVPYIKGVSNHMGSRLMEDPEKIRIVFLELKRRGLFFLDNRTSPRTVGLEVAQSLGLKATERSLFIDHISDEKEIKENLEQLIQFSLSTGKGIGIGHPHSSTLKSLKEMISKMKENGIEIVPLSAVME
jgi:polysaccharide deacetylase 2 family uncharacterized protein YibQ